MGSIHMPLVDSDCESWPALLTPIQFSKELLTFRRPNITCVDQSVKIRGILIELQKGRVLKFLLARWVLFQQQLHTLSDALFRQHEFVETNQVEFIL